MIERFWIAIAQSFKNQRIILCFPEVRAVNPELISCGIDVREFNFDFSHPAALTQFCRANDIGLIYLTDRSYSSRVYPLLRRSGVRQIIIHDHTPGTRTRPSTLKRLAKAARIRMQGADSYIACSSHVLDRLLTVGCIPPSRCHLAQNGIDLSRFTNSNRAFREALSLAPNTLLAVSCSRANHYKRITDIIDAAALLGDLNLHFIHIGDGPDMSELQSRIRARNLESRFSLLGHRDDVPDILQSCDIAIHASNGEVGLCLAILEFMASRLPVVVTDEPSVGQIIEPGITGLRFPHGNIPALAEAIRTLAHDSNLRERLGATGQKTVASRYPIEKTIASVVAILKAAQSRSHLNT